MGTTFVKNGSNVLITSDTDVISALSDMNVLPDPNLLDVIIISGELDQSDNDDAIRVNWKRVTSPVVTSRADLIQKLSADYFYKKVGVARGEEDAVLSDSVDLANPGWIQPTLLAGTIKYTTEKGNVRTRAFDLKETSLVKVKRVWSTGTTANMGIVVYFE